MLISGSTVTQLVFLSLFAGLFATSYSTGSASFRDTDDACEPLGLSYDIEFDSQYFSTCYVSI